jgi:hypothetical protein
LGVQMGPRVAKTEIGLALSRDPRFQTANRGDARAEGSDLCAAGLLVAGLGNAVTINEFGRPEAPAERETWCRLRRVVGRDARTKCPTRSH